MNFRYFQLLIVASMYIVYGLESMNFEGTDDIWKTLPEVFLTVLRHSMIYICLMTMVLLGIVHNDYVHDVQQDIGSTEYQYYFLSVYAVRNTYKDTYMVIEVIDQLRKLFLGFFWCFRFLIFLDSADFSG